MEWSTPDVFKLINLYKQFECLWNFKSATYKRTDLKNNAWLQISKQFRKDITDIKKKIKHIRTAYLAEKKKVECSKKSGSSTDFIHEPNLFYYKEMDFLDSVVILRRTTSNLKEQETFEIATEATELDSTLMEDSSDVFVLPTYSPPPCVTPSPPITIRPSSSSSCSSRPSPSPSPSSFNKRPSPSSTPAAKSFATSSPGSRPFFKQKARREAKFNSAVEAIVAAVNERETEDVFSSFGTAIARQLQQLPLADATSTMAEIQNHVTQKVLTHLRTSQQINDPRDIMQAALEEADISFE